MNLGSFTETEKDFIRHNAATLKGIFAKDRQKLLEALAEMGGGLEATAIRGKIDYVKKWMVVTTPNEQHPPKALKT